MKITKGDVNAFWALAADNLANLIIISTVCTGLFHMPARIVFGRILPGVGIALIVGLAYYAYLAIQLMKKEGRDDVTALPYGISTPVLFTYLFGVMLPVYKATNDPMAAWRVGLAAGFIGGIIEASGSLIGPFLKRVTPRSAMLGTLGGIAIVWIATVPMAQLFEHPVVGFVSIAIIFLGLVANYRLPLGLPAGLVAITIGSAIGFFTGASSWDLTGIGLYPPVPVIGDLITGLQLLFKNPYLFTIILPIEVYNFLETMNNVESANAAGDSYPVGRCQLMDGVGTMFGAIFGNPFPTTVYIGQPAYKRLGARWGYAIMVGSLYFIGNFFGIMTWLYRLIPVAAVAPMLIFVGIVILSQAFTASNPAHAPAVAVAVIPHISDLLYVKLTGMAHFLNQKITPDFIKHLEQLEGIAFNGHSILAKGAIVTGLIWGALTAAMIDHRFSKAGHFALGGLILTAVGFLHSDKLAWLPHPSLAIGYAILVVFLYTIAIYESIKQKSNVQLKD